MPRQILALGAGSGHCRWWLRMGWWLQGATGEHVHGSIGRSSYCKGLLRNGPALAYPQDSCKENKAVKQNPGYKSIAPLPQRAGNGSLWAGCELQLSRRRGKAEEPGNDLSLAISQSISSS